MERRDREVVTAQFEEDERIREKIQEDVVKNFFTTVEFIKSLSNPIQWEDIGDQEGMLF